MTPKGNVIKKELVEHFIGSKASDFSVSHERGGSLYVRVKAIIPLHQVEEYMSKYERVHRCEFTGDILAGGNQFVFVRYDRDLVIPDWLETKLIVNLKYVGEPNLKDAIDIRGKLNFAAHMLKQSLTDWEEDDIISLIRSVSNKQLPGLWKHVG
jgi:hypothetical protein